MKKLLIISLIIISLFIVLIVVTTSTKKDLGENKDQISVEELRKDISAKKAISSIFTKLTVVIVKETSPIVIPMAKDMNIDLKRLNLQEEITGWDIFNIEGTPTIVYFKDGQEVDRIQGLQTEEVFKKWFNKNK